MEIKLIGTKTNHDDVRNCDITAKVFEIGNYKAVRRIYNFEDGTSFEQYSVSVINDTRFTPDIETDEDILSDTIKGFKIQTTAYGSLTPAEIDEVIKGYQEAQEVVSILTELFL